MRTRRWREGKRGKGETRGMRKREEKV